MGSETQRSYDLGFNVRYLDKTLISVKINDFTGYFSDAMPFAFRVKKKLTIANDRLWRGTIQRHIKILEIGRTEVTTCDIQAFKILWTKALNENIITAASEIAKFRMRLIEQEYEADDSIRIRRKQR